MKVAEYSVRKTNRPHQQQVKKIKPVQNAPASNEQLRRVIKELQAMVKQQRTKRESVQEHLLLYRQRSIFKENQFKKILYKIGVGEVQKHVDIDELYNKILLNFDEYNNKTVEMIQDGFEQSVRLMDRRINQILQKMETQLSKSKKLSRESYIAIKKQISQTLYIAQTIENDNLALKKKIQKLQFQMKVINQQRKFILEELVGKKKILAKTLKQQHQQIQSKKKRFNSLNTTISIFKRTSNNEITKKHPQQNKIKQDYANPNIIMYQQSIKHLKQSLAREKKKRIQIGNIVSQLQSKNVEINNVIQECLQQEKKKLGNSAIDNLLKSQKLFQVIREIKKRLQMLQHPSINCGWKDQDLLNLLE